MGPRQQRVEAADAVHGSRDGRGHHVLLDVPPSCQRGGDLQSWGLMGAERHVGCFIFRSEFQEASRRWKWGRGLTARLACSLLVALFWLSRPSHRQGPGVPISSFAPSPVKILSSRLPLARMCSSYTRLRDRLREQQRGQKRGEEKRSVDCRGPQMLTNCLQSWWGPESPSGCPPSLWGSVWDGGGRTERDNVRKQTWPGSTLETTQPHPLVEELLDEGFPEVLLHSFGLQHQTVVELTQLIHEAERPRRRPVVLAAEVLRKSWSTQRKHSFTC